MTALLALHLVAGLGIVASGRSLGRRALLVAAVPPALAVGWLTTHLGRVLDGEVVREHVGWVPSIGLALDLRLDGFAALMALLIAGIGVAVLLYARWYFAPDHPNIERLAGLLCCFAGAMLGVAWAENVLVLYTCWELTSITSYLLIGNDHTDPRARAAALQALLITVAGGLAMLGGFIVLARAAGSYDLADIIAARPTGGASTVGLVLVLLGVATKSAQYPFHSWLPGAMVAPTPVSAYLHSATMVKAGVYLLARLAPAFAITGFWRPAVVGVGLVTMVAGGLRALRQDDLKLLLAHSTVSQLGFLTVLFGLGTPGLVEAGALLLLAHAVFKATLFMVVGILDHQTGTRDRRHLPVLGRGWGTTKVVLVLGAASMAGVPLLGGFIAKEEAYAALVESTLAARWVVIAGLVAGSALTVAYSVRLVQGVVGPRRSATDDLGAVRDPAGAPAPAPAFVAPAVVLTVVTVALGVWPQAFDRLAGVATRSLAPGAAPSELALWHGWGTPLALSALTLTLGAVVAVLAGPVSRLLAAGEGIPSGADAYAATLRGLNRTATAVTGVVQNGSLPIYAGVILLTAALAPAVSLLTSDSWTGWPDLVDHPGHIPVALLIVGSALAAAANRRRVSAVLFLGLTGYGMATLFVLQGAPDLALTTVAIETLSTVLFVLVLRYLPVRFERRATTQQRALRVIAATAIGIAVFFIALVTGGSRTEEPVSGPMVERAVPDGHGRNVVNVILVDFRGLDTLGEITVLAAAAIGMVSLARAGRKPRPRPSRTGAP